MFFRRGLTAQFSLNILCLCSASKSLVSPHWLKHRTALKFLVVSYDHFLIISKWDITAKFKFKDAANGEFQKWISQSQFSYHPLRTEKGFSEIFGSKTWVLLISFNIFLMSTTNTYKNIHSRNQKSLININLKPKPLFFFLFFFFKLMFSDS